MTLYDSLYIKFSIEVKKSIYKKSYGNGSHWVSQPFKRQMGVKIDERKVYRAEVG